MFAVILHWASYEKLPVTTVTSGKATTKPTKLFDFGESRVRAVADIEMYASTEPAF